MSDAIMNDKQFKFDDPIEQRSLQQVVKPQFFSIFSWQIKTWTSKIFDKLPLQFSHNKHPPEREVYLKRALPPQ